MTTWDAGMSVTADRLNDEPGWVAEHFRSSSSATATSTEIVVQTCTFAAVAGARYKVTAVQSVQGDAAGGSVQCRLRTANGTSVAITDLQIAVVTVALYGVNLGFVYTLVGTLDAGVTGDVSVAVTIKRNTGTANLVSFGNANMVNSILVERVG